MRCLVERVRQHRPVVKGRGRCWTVLGWVRVKGSSEAAWWQSRWWCVRGQSEPAEATRCNSRTQATRKARRTEVLRDAK